MRELELKRVVDDGFELEPERIVIPGARLAGRASRQIRDTYLDTRDLRLARWGVTLRWRDGDGWTAKIPRPSTDPSVLDRDEVHIEGGRGQVPDDAAALVAPFARHEPLVEVARLETERTARIWCTPDGDPVGELVDDRVVGSGSGRTVRFREIEFELAADHPTALDQVKAQVGGGDVAAVPKLVAVLGAFGPADVTVPSLSEQPSAAEVIHAAIARSVRHLFLHVPAARLGADPRGVHQARVATRRLRSDLRTFGPLLDKAWAKQLRAELRWMAAELGRVRDADVLDGNLAAALARAPEIDTAAGAEIRDLLAERRAADRATLLGHLADDRALELFDHLVDAAADPRIRRRAHDQPASKLLPPLVDEAWRRFDEAVHALGSEPADHELHEVRILAKRVRYASEAVIPALGKDARRFAKSAASIQDVLGELNDSFVAAAWLEEAALSDLGRRAGFAAGRLAQQLRHDAEPDRTEWQPSYDRMRRRAAWLVPT